jgi:recombination protein RecR
MSRSVAGPEIERLIQLLSKLPGLGPRSARRAALHLVKKKDELLAPLAKAMDVAVESVVVCSTCGNIDTSDPCTICTDPRRDQATGVVVEDVADRALSAPGAERIYHVLGGALSPLDGVGPTISASTGWWRASRQAASAVILAVSHVEGQTTAHYIMDRLAGTGVKVSRLAHGVPVGGELDYLDEGTLSAAIRQRTPF